MKVSLAVLLAVLTLGCQPTVATPSASLPSVPRTPQVTTPLVTTPAPTTLSTASLTPAPTSPLPTPSAGTCPRVTGGTGARGSSLVEVRIAHQPGFDRIVFDFGPGPLPQYTVEQTASFVAPSGQTVPVQGNAHLGVRFNGAGQMGAYRGPTSFRPGTPLVREVKLVEDFEGVVAWGIGLERLACPRVLVLTGPARLVVDLASPP